MRNVYTNTTANVLGKTTPLIYVNGYEYQLPTPDRGNRLENFEKEIVSWVDLSKIYHERIKGYRLKAIYSYEFLSSGDMNDLLNIYNEAENSSDIKIKFSNFPRRYQVKVTKFEHGLGGGMSFKDSAKIEFTGVILLDAFPNPDIFFTITPLLGRGLIVRSTFNLPQEPPRELPPRTRPPKFDR